MFVLTHNGDRMALLDVDDLKNFLCSAGEQEGLAMNTTLVPSC